RDGRRGVADEVTDDTELIFPSADVDGGRVDGDRLSVRSLERVPGLGSVADDPGAVQECGVREQPLETVELAALVVGWDERTQGRLDVGDVLAADRYQAVPDERRVLRADHKPAVAEWIDQELVRLQRCRGPDSRVRVEQADEARELDELLILGRRGDRRADLGELCDPRRFRADRERVRMERADFPVELIEILVPG